MILIASSAHGVAFQRVSDLNALCRLCRLISFSSQKCPDIKGCLPDILTQLQPLSPPLRSVLNQQTQQLSDFHPDGMWAPALSASARHSDHSSSSSWRRNKDGSNWDSAANAWLWLLCCGVWSPEWPPVALFLSLSLRAIGGRPGVAGEPEVICVRVSKRPRPRVGFMSHGDKCWAARDADGLHHGVLDEKGQAVSERGSSIFIIQEPRRRKKKMYEKDRNKNKRASRASTLCANLAIDEGAERCG